MFEADVALVDTELRTIFHGQLHCLPYSRTLLDYFEEQKKAARVLVARAVVFGTLTGCTWEELLKTVSPMCLFRRTVDSLHANGTLVLTLPSEDAAPPRNIQLRYRTLGYTHQEAVMGSFENDGTWYGHIVVIADNVLIDMTIGQLNDQCFGINFAPPHVMAEVNDGFLAGKTLLSGMQDEMFLCYQAFPNERTYEQSESWCDLTFRQQLRDLAKEAARKATTSSVDNKLQQFSK